MKHTLCALAIAAALLPTPLAHAQPAEVFRRDGDFQEFVAEAREQELPLLVCVSVDWAQSERQMRRSTWQDESLIETINERTVPIYIDADLSPAAAERFNALAYPTLVILNADGQTRGRSLVGFRTADQVRAWILATLGERQAISPNASDAPNARNLPATIYTALQRERAGRDDKALEFLDWTWLNLGQLAPATSAAKRSFLALPMTRLAQRDQASRDRFTKHRDDAESRLASGTLDWADLRDWVTLNAVVGQPERSLEWAHERLGSPEGLAIVRRLEAELLPIALSEQDTDLIRVICPDPPSTVLRTMQRLATLQGSRLQALDDALLDYRDDHLASFYASLLALGMDELADETARTIFVRTASRADALRLRMIEAAIRWQQPRAVHREWIDRLSDDTDEARVGQISQALEAALGGQ